MILWFNLKITVGYAPDLEKKSIRFNVILIEFICAMAYA